MQHIKLSDDTILKSEKQVAAKFIELKPYAEDLKLLNKTIKPIGNAAYDWARQGIALNENAKYSSFSKDRAIELMKEYGVPQDKIDSCTKRGTTAKVSLARS